MNIKCYYNRNLNMPPEKLAAQVGHVIAHFSAKHQCVPSKIIVLKASKTKFEEFKNIKGDRAYVHKDLGLTLLDKDTETVIGWTEL